MTVAEAGQIFDYWAGNPPVHLMVQIIARNVGEAAGDGVPALGEIIAMAPPGLSVAAGGDIGMPAPVLDINVARAQPHAIGELTRENVASA